MIILDNDLGPNDDGVVKSFTANTCVNNNRNSSKMMGSQITVAGTTIIDESQKPTVVLLAEFDEDPDDPRSDHNSSSVGNMSECKLPSILDQ